jgi:hypothetical protein
VEDAHSHRRNEDYKVKTEATDQKQHDQDGSQISTPPTVPKGGCLCRLHRRAADVPSLSRSSPNTEFSTERNARSMSQLSWSGRSGTWLSAYSITDDKPTCNSYTGSTKARQRAHTLCRRFKTGVVR